MSRVIGGIRTDRDNLVHTTYTHNPSTLRLSSDMQQTPRTNDPLSALVRGMFIAPDGMTFWARDFTGIEAVLVGYFANSQRYTRLAKLGVHDYFNAHMLKQNRLITEADMPDLKWTDADLKECFSGLKLRFKVERDVAKRCVHLSNYLGTPKRMHAEYPESFPTAKDAELIQGMYFELFNEIPQWHQLLCLTVDGNIDEQLKWKCMAGEAGSGYVRNPFGGVHRFWNVLQYSQDKSGNTTWDYGEDARRLIACLPQSTASAIMKLAMLGLWVHPRTLENARQNPGYVKSTPEDWLGASLRLSIHDEILGLCYLAELAGVQTVSKVIMERNWHELPLNPEWGMGEHLSIGTEFKHGPCWATMR